MTAAAAAAAAAAATVRRSTRSSRSCRSRESSTFHDACRSPSSREEAPYLRDHAHRVNESINIRTQQKPKQHNDYWQQQQTGPTAVARHEATAAARQEWRPATSERAPCRPFDDSSLVAARCLGLSHVLCVFCRLFLAMIRTSCLRCVSGSPCLVDVCVAPWVFCYYKKTRTS